MGVLLNPNNTDFEEATNAEIYVDKTELIAYANKVIRTPQKYICVSRPRRFGKSMAANMLTAYYSKGCDSKKLFKPYKIAKSDSFEKHLNKYNIIHINMVEYIGESRNIDEMIQFIEEDIIAEITDELPDLKMPRRINLVNVLNYAFAQYGIPFVFIIDEWDCIFRMRNTDQDSQTMYLNFLRNLLKDKSYVALAYMTGIFPIKKYGEHSAINIFYEFSMTNAKPISEFTGFSVSFISDLENGKATAELGKAIHYANLLGLDVELNVRGQG